MDNAKIKKILDGLVEAEKKTINKCRRWAVDSEEDDRIAELCAKIENVVTEFIPDIDLDDFLLIGMSFVKINAYGTGREHQKEILHTLAASMCFNINVSDIEDEI